MTSKHLETMMETPTTKDSDTLHTLVYSIIYGDMHEVPLKILGNDCPDYATYKQLDTEQKTRLAIAATVQKWFDNNKER